MIRIPSRQPDSAGWGGILACILALLLLQPASAQDAQDAQDVQDAHLEPCVQMHDAHFLALREVVVVDALARVPAAVAQCSVMTISQYVRAQGEERTPVHIAAELNDGLVVRCAQHWLMIACYCTYVRRDAVSMIDERPGSVHFSPATPAVPGGAQALAQPDAIGVTVSVGMGRVFTGVRTQARSLTVTHQDVCVLAALVQAPTALMVLSAIEARPLTASASTSSTQSTRSPQSARSAQSAQSAQR